jgi:hypothetical protein
MHEDADAETVDDQDELQPEELDALAGGVVWTKGETFTPE